MSPLRLVAITAGVLGWFALLFALPACAQWLAVEMWGPAAGLLGGAAGFLLALVGTVVGIVWGVAWSARRARERVLREGVRCTAFVHSYRRVSMTQHRVLWEIHFPAGPAGREYMLAGLSDAWLADVCALRRPVSVVAHPESDTLVIAG